MDKVELDINNVLAAEAKVPSGIPVTMINLVEFFPDAKYDDPNQKQCSGMEAYIQRYAPAFNRVAAELGVKGIEVVYVGTVAHTILGPVEPKWDAIAVVRYPNFAALRTVTESPLYSKEAEKPLSKRGSSSQPSSRKADRSLKDSSSVRFSIGSRDSVAVQVI